MHQQKIGRVFLPSLFCWVCKGANSINLNRRPCWRRSPAGRGRGSADASAQHWSHVIRSGSWPGYVGFYIWLRRLKKKRYFLFRTLKFRILWGLCVHFCLRNFSYPCEFSLAFMSWKTSCFHICQSFCLLDLQLNSCSWSSSLLPCLSTFLNGYLLWPVAFFSLSWAHDSIL